MGRAFEYRKERKFKRWDKMSKVFTKLGKEIAIAVKQGGSDPEANTRLRAAIQTAKTANMPKANVEAAIKRASSKDEKALEEIVYEGVGPHGVAIVVETATDNPNRTVANIRMYFNRSGGELGKSGSLEYLFQRKGVFSIAAEGVNLEEVELELIDAGLEELTVEEDGIYIQTSFTDYGTMQKTLEAKGFTIRSAELQRIPGNMVELNDEQAESVIALIEKFEDDDDVQNVFHNMK